MAKKTLDDCRTGRDFTAYANSHGGRVDHQTGSHAIVRGPNGGVCAVPVHARDLGTGIRHKIIKTFIAIGLALLVIAGAASLLPM